MASGRRRHRRPFPDPGSPRDPAGGYFDGLAARRAAGLELTEAEIDEFARRHGQINVR